MAGAVPAIITMKEPTMRYFGSSHRNQPVRLESLKTSQTRYPAPRDRGNVAQDGYDRLSTADPATGIRQPVGGQPVYPAYHEDP